MTDSHPEFAFRIDEDMASWSLYRQTKTQERPVAIRTRDRLFWFGQDREEGNGTRAPVREDFLDAVAALFLRELRTETMATRRPGADGRSLPSEAWDLVTVARSHFTLSESRAFKACDPSTRDHDRGDHPDDSSLAEFSPLE